MQNLTQDKLNTVCRLNEIAHTRGETMAQLTLVGVGESSHHKRDHRRQQAGTNP